MLTQMLMWAQMILKKVHTFIIKPLECMSAAAKDRIALFSRLNIKCRSTAILEPTKNKCEERLLVLRGMAFHLFFPKTRPRRLWDDQAFGAERKNISGFSVVEEVGHTHVQNTNVAFSDTFWDFLIYQFVHIDTWHHISWKWDYN